jgi:hypothetical protein
MPNKIECDKASPKYDIFFQSTKTPKDDDENTTKIRDKNEFNKTFSIICGFILKVNNYNIMILSQIRFF